MTDTPPEIMEMVAAGYRGMSPREKLRQVSELTKGAQQFALARIRKQYGSISEREQQLRLAALWLPRKTMIEVFQWDPEEKGY